MKRLLAGFLAGLLVGGSAAWAQVLPTHVPSVAIGGGGGGAAPADATYITQTPNALLTSEQALNSLTANRLLRNTTGGVLADSLLSDSGTNATLTSGQLLLPDGTAAAPSLAFTSSTSSGLARISASVNLVHAGIRVLDTGGTGGSIRYFQGQNGFGFANGAVAPTLFLYWDTANTLAQRNSTNAQTTRIYGTFTDASNFERLALFTTIGTGVTIAAQTEGTGADNLGLTLTPAGTGNITISSGQLLLPDGDGANPSMSFTSDADTGFFARVGTGISLSIDGGTVLEITDSTFQSSINIQAPSGTAGAPSITFLGDTNNGIFRIAADEIGVTTAGIQRLSIDGTDLVATIPFRGSGGTTAAPTYSFSSESGTGMYLQSPGQIGLTLLGVDSIVLSSGFLQLLAGQIIAPNGTVGAPTYSFTSSLSTGITWTGSALITSITGTARTAVFTTGLQLGSSGGLSWTSGDPTLSADLSLFRDAADVLAQRRSTNPQELRVYNTFTSATNFEIGKLEWASNVFNVGTEKGSGGGTARAMSFLTDNIARWQLETDGDLVALADARALVSRVNAPAALGAGVTTFAVSSNIHVLDCDAGGNTISTITGGTDGQMLTITLVDINCTFSDDNDPTAADAMNLQGSASYAPAQIGSTLTLVRTSGSWKEIARSVNQ